MGYGYAVFGLGRQGLAAAHDLVVNCQAEVVLGFDPDEQQRQLARARLGELLGRDAPLSVADSRDVCWPDLPAKVRVVLSCAPYRVNPELTRACLRVGLPMCDLGGNPGVVGQQQAMAAGSDVPIVPECGLAPGIANVAAVHLAKRHHADRIQVRCGGIPLEPPDAAVNPLRYKLSFDPQGLISEYSGRCPIIEDGTIAYVDACGRAEPFDEQHECFPTSNNAVQVAEYLRECGVRSYDYKTIRYQGHLACVHGWKALGFLRGDAKLDATLRELLSSSPALQYDRHRDRDKIILAVRGWRSDAEGSNPVSEYRIDLPADRKTGFAAMELTTAWGITVVAHHMCSGRGAPRGFATPERFVDTGWFLDEIDRRVKQAS